MLKQLRFFLVALSVLVCIGCERKKLAGVYVSDGEFKMDELSPRDVILVVNGEKFTKKDFLVAVGLFDKISRLRAGDDLTGPNKNAEAAVKATNARTLSDMLRRALIRQYAQKHGISPLLNWLKVWPKSRL
jgi:hypothetical protein